MTGAPLPKRAESASATCPAGTIGTALGAVARGVVSGHSVCGTSTPPGPNGSPREPGVGAISPVVGAAENREFCPAACADAGCGTSKGKMSAECRPQAAAGGECGWMAHDGAVFGPNRGDFKPLGRFVTPEALC